MKEIGEFLKSSRVANGVSIEEASEDLNITAVEIENLEEGNIRAFKDIYSLKNLVKEYSKYLGQDPDKLLDEFNDFMFEHTSKISLDDIKEARKLVKKEDERPKVVSPYTQIKVKKNIFKKVKWKRILVILGIITILVGLFFIWNLLINKNDENISTELKGGVLYEYTN